MINFKEELKKYEYILSVDDVEASINSDEIKDLMELLQYITEYVPTKKSDKE